MAFDLEFLAFSGKCKLYDIPVDSKAKLEEEVKPLAEELFKTKNASRIRNLRLSSPPESWLSRITGSLFSQLERLAFKLHGGTNTTFGSELGLASFPYLCELRLGGFYTTVQPLAQFKQFLNITVLTLYHVPLDFAINTLKACPILSSVGFIIPLAFLRLRKTQRAQAFHIPPHAAETQNFHLDHCTGGE
jgi:hypothetical protein